MTGAASSQPQATELTASIKERARHIRLVAADMDGTLLDQHGEIPEGFWAVARRLHERGVMMCPASGRQYATLMSMFAPISDGLPIIAENGALAIMDGTPLHMQVLGWEVVLRAITRLRDAGVRCEFVVCTAERAYTDSHDPAFLDETSKYYHALEFVDDVATLGMDVLKLAVFDYSDAEAHCFPHFSDFMEDYNVTVSAQLWLDIMAKGVNKGNAIVHMCQRLGLDRNEVLAFGDFMNDLELIEAAGMSFAMANGHPSVIEAADYIAPANTEQGVLTVLEQLFDLD